MIATSRLPSFLPVWAVLAGALLLGACSGTPIHDWPWIGRGTPDGEGTGADASPVARPEAGRAVALRIRDESERESLRIAAIANDVLAQHGFRPDGTARAVLVLRFDRPRTLSAPGRPAVGIFGRGGSSGTSDIGVSIELPVGRGPAPAPPARHEVIAELETQSGKVVWRERAAKDAPAAAEIDSLLARELIGRVIERLRREADRQTSLFAVER